jgi:DNA-binding FrmR family transcriptional regulator
LVETSSTSIEGTAALTDDQKTELLHRLIKIEDQLHGVRKLVTQAEVPSDCDVIAQRMSAARKALDRAYVTFLTGAITTHTSGAKNMEEASLRAKTLAEMLGKSV